MDVNNFLQSEATQFVGTAAANTIGLVIGTIHEDIKELLEIPDEYQAISIVSSRTGTVAQAIAIDDAVKAVNAKLLRFEMQLMLVSSVDRDASSSSVQRTFPMPEGLLRLR